MTKNRWSVATRLAFAAVALVWMIHRTPNVHAQTDDAGPAAGKRTRPAPNVDLRVNKLPARLEEILKEWERASGRIQTLEGSHFRWEYDLVFSVETRAKGAFYYKAPDKGRIDLIGRKPEPGEVSPRKSPKTGQPFTIQAAHPEKWICDGKTVWQIDDAQKTAEQYVIPPEQRGRNIIDGPLPFLFGMPAEKAKKRFAFRLLQESPTDIWLSVTPRWKQDAANYQQATVILNKKSYLPNAVQLVHPPGNKETAFQFQQLRVNQKDNIFDKILSGRNPFKPSLRGYKVINHKVTTDQTQTETAQNAQAVPSVVGFPWEMATNLLKKTGYVVKYQRGDPAARDELVYVVYRQQPEPKTPLPKGEVVVLTLYDKASAPVQPAKR